MHHVFCATNVFNSFVSIEFILDWRVFYVETKSASIRLGFNFWFSTASSFNQIDGTGLSHI